MFLKKIKLYNEIYFFSFLMAFSCFLFVMLILFFVIQVAVDGFPPPTVVVIVEIIGIPFSILSFRIARFFFRDRMKKLKDKN